MYLQTVRYLSESFTSSTFMPIFITREQKSDFKVARFLDSRGAWCASRARSNHFFGLFPRRFRRATNARLSCATRRARGGSNVRDGCETSSDVQSQRVVLKTRDSKSPSLVWRVTPCGWRSRRLTPFQSERVENGRHHRRLSGADRHARGDSNVRNG